MPLPLVGAAVAAASTAIARYVIPYILIKIAIGLGLTVITYVGMSWINDVAVDAIRNHMSGFPASIADIFFLAGGGDAVEISMAGWVAAIQVKQVRGAFKKITFGLQE